MVMPGRNYTSANGYRYGFQGQEKDDEIKGANNSLNYKWRMHDPRVGRFFSVDPLAAKYPFWSPYAFSGNRVIDARELEGLEPERVTGTAEDYEGTPYEFGGKDPAFEGGLPDGVTQDYYDTYVGEPSRDNGGAFNNPNYTNEVNLNQFLTNGESSCGIDCSGLSGTAFNSDEQKLMGDFNLNMQGANAQKQAFMNAGANGFLGTDFANIQEGDLVFNGNETNRATHVMVATGNTRVQNGRTQIQVIHAPQTGSNVQTEYRDIGNNWSFGRTFRTTDNVLTTVEITADRTNTAGN